LVELQPNDGFAHFQLGLACEKGSELSHAADAYKHATAMNPRNAQAWTALGSVYLQLGTLSEAERTLLQAVNIAPEYVLAHELLGKTYAAQHRYRESSTEQAKAATLMYGIMSDPGDR
jgi:tetratricopeptide (TPR) repeat protein